ncbi:2567_t:CDS:1, partial [Ambispora leptoticha]
MLSAKAWLRASWYITNLARKTLSSLPMFMAPFRPMTSTPTDVSSSE